MKTRKELERSNNILFWMFIVLLLIAVVFSMLDERKISKLDQQLSKCQEQVYCSDTFKDAMSDSCMLGCIYSTKFYYDNPKIDFKESSYDCMLNCLEKAQDIQDKFSFCEVISE